MFAEDRSRSLCVTRAIVVYHFFKTALQYALHGDQRKKELETTVDHGCITEVATGTGKESSIGLHSLMCQVKFGLTLLLLL